MINKSPKRKQRKTNKHRVFLNQQRHKYEKTLASQNGHCALCSREPKPNRRLNLDHSHKDMRLRGLLCFQCNRALREFMDAEWLEAAAKYVKNDL